MTTPWNNILAELAQELSEEVKLAANEASAAERENRRDDAFRGLGRAAGLKHAVERILATVREHNPGVS